MKKTANAPREREFNDLSLKQPRSHRAKAGVGLASVLGLVLIAWATRARLSSHRGAPLPSPAATASMDPSEARLRDMVARQPKAAAPHAALGEYALSQARPGTALWELEIARSLQSRDDSTLAREHALALERMNHRDLAIEELRSRLGTHPDDTSTRAQLAEMLLPAGQPADAVAVLHVQSKSFPMDPEALLCLGRGYLALGRLEEARAVLQRYATVAPSTDPRNEPLGRFLLATHRAEEARRALMQDQHVAFRTAEFHYLLGRTYLEDPRRPDLGKAGAAFTVALHFDQRHAQAHEALGEVLERRGAKEQAEAEYDSAIQINPTLPGPHLKLAHLLMQSGQVAPSLQHSGIAATLQDRLPEAKTAFHRMLTASPGDLDAIQSFILTCVAMKRVDLARPGIAALQQRPFDSGTADRVAKLYLITGARQPCRDLAQRWRDRSPKSAAALRLAGGLAVDDLRVSEGIKLFEDAWSAAPDHAETAAALGNAWARVPTRANLQRAEEWLGRAVSLAPDTAAYQDGLGRVLEQLGRTAEAQAVYLRALDRDASLASAASGLTHVAERTNQPAVARLFGRLIRATDTSKRVEEAARRRLWDRPDDPEAQLAVARILLAHGEYEKAASHLQQALLFKPAWPAAQQLDRTVEAMRAWSR